MPKSRTRTREPFNIIHRKDSDTYQFTLNTSCGLPERVCNEWKRTSFQRLPSDLANHRHPKTMPAARAAVFALISFLNKIQDEEGSARRIATEDITVGAWIEKFTTIETSPRTGINASKNRSYSLNTVDTYFSYFKCHIKDDPICKLKMSEIEEEDVLEYVTRLSIKKFVIKKDDKEIEGEEIGGSRTFSGVISFMRMAFSAYQKKAKRWFNPFQYIDAPKSDSKPWDALTEDEVVRLFEPGILIETMELAVCGIMFLSGLRRGEYHALRPEELDWSEKNPKVWVDRAWQRFNRKGKKSDRLKERK